MPTLGEYRAYLATKQARRDAMVDNVSRLRERVGEQERQITDLDEARQIVAAVLLATQQDAKTQIEHIVTMLLRAVFGAGRGFAIEYVERRGKPEVDFYVLNGTERELIQKSLPPPGGVCDTVALGLRIACWALESPRSAPVLILDEPLRFVHGEEFVRRISVALHQMTSELGLQIIAVGADDELAEIADRAWSVTLCNGTSQVERVK